MKLGVLLVLMATLYGCSNTGVKEYDGVYTYGHEVRIFKDTKSNQEYWVTGEEGVIDKLDAHMESLRDGNKENYPKERLKIKGVDEGEATNGFAQPGDRKLKVIQYEIVGE